MKVIRFILGKIILLLNAIFSPKSPKHSPSVQAALDDKTKVYRLYQYAACPFCVKVRREIKRLGINIEIVDAKETTNRAFLMEHGGKTQVPALLLSTEQTKPEFMYESAAIIQYLQQYKAA